MDPRVFDEIKAEIARIGGDRKKLDDGFRSDLDAARKLAEDGKSGTAEVAILANSAVAKYEALELQQKALETRITGEVERMQTALNRRPGSRDDADSEARLHADAREFKAMRLSWSARALRPGQEIEVTAEDVDGFKAYTRAFELAVLRKTEKEFTGEEIKALTTGSDPDGGYWVPPAMSAKVLGRVRDTSPMRQLADVVQIGTDRIEIPIDDDDIGAGWVGEEETRPETTTPQLRSQIINVDEQYAKPKATQRLLEDAVINVPDWLANKLADKFARMEATAFISGNGVKKPRGLITYPAGTVRGTVRQFVTGDATKLMPDPFVTIPTELAEPYLTNARWLMKRSSLAAVALFKNTTTTEYLWGEGLNGKIGMQIAGYPVAFADDMPAVAAGALAVAFGDFRQAYTVVDRLGITMLRDPYSSKPFVEFYSRRRVGGDVTQFEAFSLLRVAVS